MKVSTEAPPKEYCFVNVNHGNGKKPTIVYPSGEMETKDIEAFGGNGIEINSKLITKVLNDLAKKGYTLKSSGGGDYFYHFVFEK